VCVCVSVSVCVCERERERETHTHTLTHSHPSLTRKAGSSLKAEKNLLIEKDYKDNECMSLCV